MQPNPQRWALAFGWAATVVLSFWLGRSRAPVVAHPPLSPLPIAPVGMAPAIPASSPTRAVRLSQEKAATDTSALREAPPAPADPFDGGLRGISTRGALDVLSQNDPIDRTAAFLALLRRLDRTNAYELLDAFEQGEFGFDRGREYGLFLYAWGQVDGPAAAKHLQEKGGNGWDRMRDMQGVMSGWATRDPDGAVAWARENWKGEENPYLVGVINGLAKSDLARATALAESLPYGRVRGQAADILVDGHLQKGEQAAMDWAESLTDEKLRAGIIQRVGLKVGQKDPALASDWVLAHTAAEKKSETVAMIMDSWGRMDPASAATWVEGQSDPALKSESTARLTGVWARRDAEAAGQWLSKQTPGPALDPALESYARAVRREDPAKALQWAGAITDTEKRRQSLERLMAEWTERDPDAARAFLNKKAP